jgi:hypothetical protein
VSKHINEDRPGAKLGPAQEGELSAGRPTSLRTGDTTGLVTIANIGLVGVPLAYATSQSILITLVAAALAVIGVIGYLLVHRHR